MSNHREPIKYNYGVVNVSKEIYEDALRQQLEFNNLFFGPPPTPEQLAERKAARDQRLVEQAMLHTKLLNHENKLVASLAKLHFPDEYEECTGCSFGEDSCSWPCPTIQLVIDYLNA